MKDKKNIIFILSAIVLLFAIGLFVKVMNTSKEVSTINDESKESGYGEKYFDRNKVMDVNIELEEELLNDMFENAKDEEYKTAKVIINGDTYNNIGVRAKGNSSLNAVASNPDSDRYSLKIRFDKYEENQTMEGLTQLNLNNCYSDPSYMREFIAYSIFEDMGLKTPEFAYAKVSINGEYHGLYLAVENILEPFLENNFEYTTGDLYKSTGTNGGSLVYNGDEISNYEDLDLKSNYDTDSSKLIQMIKSLNDEEDIEKYLDIDSVIKYIAVNTAILNLDSYQGTFAHNYYLYEQNGKFTIIPWDLNMAFGGFEQGKSNSEQLINIESPSMVSVEKRPLVNLILSNDEYKEKYYKCLEDIVNKYLDSDYVTNMTSQIYDLISSYVKEDPTAFYTFEEFEANITTSVADTQTNMGTDKKRPDNMELPNDDINGNMEMPDGVNIQEGMEVPDRENLNGFNPPEGMERPDRENINSYKRTENIEITLGNDNKINGKGQKEKTLPGILELVNQMSEDIKKQLNK